MYCILFQASHQLDWYWHLFWLKYSMFSISHGAFAQTLSGAGCAPRGHCFTLHWSCSSFLINGLMYGFGAEAKAYGNLLLLHWNMGNESQCSSIIQPTPLPWPSPWMYCHSGHCHKPKQGHVIMCANRQPDITRSVLHSPRKEEVFYPILSMLWSRFARLDGNVYYYVCTYILFW